MKNKILLKSFLLLALIFTLSSVANASEVTGVLSSSGVTSGHNTGGGSGGGSSSGGSSSGTVVSGNLGGNTVSGGTTGNTGLVLGASTFIPNPPTLTKYSLKGSTPEPSPTLLVQDNGTSTTNIAPVAPNESSNQVATSLGGFGNFSIGSWLLIILLLLLLVATITYLYSRTTNRTKLRQV